MKNKFIKFRVSSVEFLLIKKKARATGLSTSEFIRSTIFEGTMYHRLSDEEIEVYKTLTKYSNAFVSISNYLKSGDVDGVKKHALDTSKLIRKHIKKLL